MADDATKPGPGVTGLDKPAGETRPSVLSFQDTTGVKWYLWVDDDGDLRIDAAADCEVAGYDWESTGTAVGGQS